MTIQSVVRPCAGVVYLVIFMTMGRAQSPLENRIRIENKKWIEAHADAEIIRGTLSSRGGYGRGNVVVKAKNPEEAQQAAIRYVYIKTIRNVGVPLKEFEAFRDKLAEAQADIKSLRTKLLSTQKTSEGYAVTVELAQSTGEIEQDLRKTAYSNFRLVALMPETIDGERVDAPKVETALAGALAKKQFRVYDWNFVSARRPLANLIAATLSNQTESATQLGSQMLANVIVVGRVNAKFSQNNDGIFSYRATANLRVIKSDTGQILTAKEYEEKGFGQDRTQAARASLNNLAEAVAKTLPDELESHFDEYPVTVQIPLQRPEQAKEVEAYLRSLTGVKDVTRTLTANGASFRLISREKPTALAAHIQESQDYRLTRFYGKSQ